MLILPSEESAFKFFQSEWKSRFFGQGVHLKLFGAICLQRGKKHRISFLDAWPQNDKKEKRPYLKLQEGHYHLLAMSNPREVITKEGEVSP